jgi:hypothetical protein
MIRKLYNLVISDNIMNETLANGGILTIRMIGSYVNHSQHTIATSQLSSMQRHTLVSICYINGQFVT